MPALGGVALWVKFLDSDDPDLIACTDGIHVEAGRGYEKYDDAERRFIVLRELLQVALAHPARGREMERRTQDFDAQLYNQVAASIKDQNCDRQLNRIYRDKMAPYLSSFYGAAPRVPLKSFA